MAKVLVALRVNPLDENVDLDKLVEKVKKNLPKDFEIVKHEKTYIAFGLYALRLYVIMPEEFEGGTEKLEDYLKGIEDISSVDIEYVTRTEAF